MYHAKQDVTICARARRTKRISNTVGILNVRYQPFLRGVCESLFGFHLLGGGGATGPGDVTRREAVGKQEANRAARFVPQVGVAGPDEADERPCHRAPIKPTAKLRWPHGLDTTEACNLFATRG